MSSPNTTLVNHLKVVAAEIGVSQLPDALDAWPQAYTLDTGVIETVASSVARAIQETGSATIDLEEQTQWLQMVMVGVARHELDYAVLLQRCADLLFYGGSAWLASWADFNIIEPLSANPTLEERRDAEYRVKPHDGDVLGEGWVTIDASSVLNNLGGTDAAEEIVNHLLWLNDPTQPRVDLIIGWLGRLKEGVDPGAGIDGAIASPIVQYLVSGQIGDDRHLVNRTEERSV